MAETGASLKWEALKNMPTKRVYSTVTHQDGILYVIGGCDEKGEPLDAFESYDVKKDRWKRLSNMPTPRAATATAVLNNCIYCFGGIGSSQAPMKNVEKYDIEGKRWEALAPLNEELMGISTAQNGNRVYLLGGMARNSDPKDFFTCFDEDSSPQWQTYPPMPTCRYATSSFLIRNKLYVIGGRQGKVPVATFGAFDFEEKKWRSLPDIPSKRVFPCYAATGTHIFSLGGLNKNPREGFSSACDVYDIEKGEWTQGTPMSQGRGDFACGVIDGKLVVTGGLSNEGKPLKHTEVYDLSSNNWTTIQDLPTAHCSCTFIERNNKLYIVGGLSTAGPSNALEVLSCK